MTSWDDVLKAACTEADVTLDESNQALRSAVGQFRRTTEGHPGNREEIDTKLLAIVMAHADGNVDAAKALTTECVGLGIEAIGEANSGTKIRQAGAVVMMEILDLEAPPEPDIDVPVAPIGDVTIVETEPAELIVDPHIPDIADEGIQIIHVDEDFYLDENDE